MKKKHHTETMVAAADLVMLWQAEQTAGNLLSPTGFNLAKAVGELGNPAQVKQMGKWVAAADDLDDLVVEKGLASFIMERVSNATSFQHFVYCGALGDLEDGPTTVKAHDGYCWDCDPYLKWYEEVANLSYADVAFRPDCGVFNEAFFQHSPANKMITGTQDWDDQVYPSALDMAQFYGAQAGRLKKSQRDWALQSLCFAIHMLQDTTVPQHVLCTIELEHAAYEQDMLDFWKVLYSGRSERGKRDALLQQLSPMVQGLLGGQLASATSFFDIGVASVALTRCRLGGSVGQPPPRTKMEARALTAQAIACTLRAIELY